MLRTTRSLRPLGISGGASLPAGAAATAAGGAPACRLPLRSLPALRVVCSTARGSPPADRSGWNDAEKLNAMAARLLAAKQAGASSSGDGAGAAGGQAAPRSSATGDVVRPASSTTGDKKLSRTGPSTAAPPKGPGPLKFLVGASVYFNCSSCTA